MFTGLRRCSFFTHLFKTTIDIVSTRIYWAHEYCSSKQCRLTLAPAAAVIMCFAVVCSCLVQGAAAQVKPMPVQASRFSGAWDHKFVAQVLTQLRAISREKGDAELTELLQRVRIEVPTKSLVTESPNAYAVRDPASPTSWVFIESRWMDQVAGFAELGALADVTEYGEESTSFSKDVFYDFCFRYQATYREALRKGGPPHVYQFRFDDFLSRSDPYYALNFVLFDKLSGIVWTNTIVWTVLHEVGHHALKHTVTAAPSNQVSRQRELDADQWAFSRMNALGYSLFGVKGFFSARLLTDACFAGLGAPDEEKDSTHPTWDDRLAALRKGFDASAAPAQDPRLFYIPMGIPEPVLTTITIPDSSSKDFDATIIQGGRVHFGLTEWNGKTVTVYARESAGGRVEFVVGDAGQVAQLIEQRTYDQNNRLIQSMKLHALQGDTATLDFLEIGGMKVVDIRKRAQGQNLMTIHLRRAGVSEPAIRQALVASGEFKEDRHHIGLQYAKGEISGGTFESEVLKRASNYEQRLIGILGESRYRAFTESFANEAKDWTPPMSGIDRWEEELIKKNTVEPQRH